MILALLLFIICVFVLVKTKEPPKLLEVKQKYAVLREHMATLDDPDFVTIKRQLPITGFYKMSDAVGFNTNKGYEIGLCLDGSPNEIFHVLLHELAHCTVTEYSHSEKFWDNFKKLKDIAIQLQIYTAIPKSTPFCGQHIRDPV